MWNATNVWIVDRALYGIFFLLGKIGDATCSVNCDCEDAVPNSRCNEGACLCLLGYQNVNQSTGCLLRQIGDNCTIHDDCFQAVDFSHCDVITSTCACNSGRHTLHDDNSHCSLRKIDDRCNVDSDCIDAIADSYCDVISCHCKSGYYVTRNGTTCTRRHISDKCYLETDCSDAVTDSYCYREPREITTTVTTVSSEDFVSNISTINSTHNNRTKQHIFNQTEFSRNENNLINSHLNDNQSEWKIFTHLVTDDAKRSMENVTFEGYPHNVSRTLQNVDVAGNVTWQKRSMLDDTQNGSKKRNSTSMSFDAEIIIETFHSESSPPAAETMAYPTEVYETTNSAIPHANGTLTMNNTTKLGYVATRDQNEVDETTRSGISDGNYTLTNSTVSVNIKTNSELIANSSFSNETLSTDEFLKETTETDSRVTMTTRILDLPGYCTCKSGYKIGYNKSTCIKRIIGDTCNVQSDCLDVINNSTCLNITFWGNNLQICACDIGLKEAVNGSTCVPRLIGEHCLNSLDCTSVGNSTCRSNSGSCECDVAFYPSEDNTTCILRKVGDSCESDTQCSIAVNNSFCSSQKSCYPDTSTNCSVSENCDETISAKSCMNPRKVCTCVLGYLPKQNSSTCVKSESRCPHSRVLFEVWYLHLLTKFIN